MSERRPIAAALDMTPERLAFVRGEPMPVSRPKPVPKDSLSIQLPPAVTDVKEPEATPTPKTATPAKQASRPPKKPSNDDASDLSGILIPITTRLSIPTANALDRAYLEQKLNKATPATKQEILEIALEAWLKDHGYLT